MSVGYSTARCESLTVERAGVDEPEEAPGGQEHVHGISEPIGQDQQQKRGHEERLRLEVVDLSKDAARGNLSADGVRGCDGGRSRSESREPKTEEHRAEGDGRELGVVPGRQHLGRGRDSQRPSGSDKAAPPTLRATS